MARQTKGVHTGCLRICACVLTTRTAFAFPPLLQVLVATVAFGLGVDKQVREWGMCVSS